MLPIRRIDLQWSVLLCWKPLPRMMSQKEMFRLQGVRDGRLTRPLGVTRRQVNLMIGNAFSVNVFQRVLARALPAVGLSGQICDPIRPDRRRNAASF